MMYELAYFDMQTQSTKIPKNHEGELIFLNKSGRRAADYVKKKINPDWATTNNTKNRKNNNNSTSWIGTRADLKLKRKTTLDS